LVSVSPFLSKPILSVLDVSPVTLEDHSASILVRQVALQRFDGDESKCLEARTQDPNVGGFLYQGAELIGAKDVSGLWMVYQIPSVVCTTGGGEFEVFGMQDFSGNLYLEVVVTSKLEVATQDKLLSHSSTHYHETSVSVVVAVVGVADGCGVSFSSYDLSGLKGVASMFQLKEISLFDIDGSESFSLYLRLNLWKALSVSLDGVPFNKRIASDTNNVFVYPYEVSSTTGLLSGGLVISMPEDFSGPVHMELVAGSFEDELMVNLEHGAIFGSSALVLSNLSLDVCSEADAPVLLLSDTYLVVHENEIAAFSVEQAHLRGKDKSESLSLELRLGSVGLNSVFFNGEKKNLSIDGSIYVLATGVTWPIIVSGTLQLGLAAGFSGIAYFEVAAVAAQTSCGRIDTAVTPVGLSLLVIGLPALSPQISLSANLLDTVVLEDSREGAELQILEIGSVNAFFDG